MTNRQAWALAPDFSDNPLWPSVKLCCSRFFLRVGNRFSETKEIVTQLDPLRGVQARRFLPGVSRLLTNAIKTDIRSFFSEIDELLIGAGEDPLSPVERGDIARIVARVISSDIIRDNKAVAPVSDQHAQDGEIPIELNRTKARRRSMIASVMGATRFVTFDRQRSLLVDKLDEFRGFCLALPGHSSNEIAALICESRISHTPIELGDVDHQSMTVNDLRAFLSEDFLTQKVAIEDPSWWQPICEGLLDNGCDWCETPSEAHVVDPSVAGAFVTSYNDLYNYHASTSPQTFVWDGQGKRKVLAALGHNLPSTDYQSKSRILSSAAQSNDPDTWRAALNKVGYTGKNIPYGARRNEAGWYFAGGVIATIYPYTRLGRR